MQSLICANLLSINAHLFNRVAAHHFKVYIAGSRNGIAILDSDKTQICLRNALLFLGSIIRQKGRLFSLHTNNLFVNEIFSEMAGLIKDSQWKIEGTLNHSFSRKNTLRSKNTLGLNKKPDCVLLMDVDRKSSIILRADRSQIPIVSLIDHTIPLTSLKKITYPIPATGSLQFIYQFANLLAKDASLQNSPPTPHPWRPLRAEAVEQNRAVRISGTIGH
ncbi:ribosomal protein S2 [Carex littledalei]|uniref:Ribosomal protein S2 n=1 Tax=Carex littledalei TaxID=544730 RepID=A0A833VLX5_9POAL|nr:ribosomal protein S2 [Carex littledalei]